MSGLNQGDIIIQLDGKKVAEPNDVEHLLAAKKPTDSATLKVRRGRKTMDITVKIQGLPKLENLPKGIL